MFFLTPHPPKGRRNRARDHDAPGLRSHSVALGRTRSRSVAFGRTRSHSVALGRVRSHSVALRRTRSHSDAPGRTRRHFADIALFPFPSPLSPYLPPALRPYTLIKKYKQIQTYFLNYVYNIEHTSGGGMFFLPPPHPFGSPQYTRAPWWQRGGNAAPPRALRTCGGLSGHPHHNLTSP
jgi:hypothetical protein